MSAILCRLFLSATIVATATAAFAQHLQMPANAHAVRPHDHSNGAGPFSAEIYGAFRSMMQRDSTAKVELGQAMSKGANIAVGAASGLRAEITILDGKPVISYGDACSACPAPDAETATLLVTGKVAAWAPPIPLPHDLSGRALDRFIIEQAKMAGLDMNKPFPIRIKGTLTNVAMHVIKSANAKFGGHGSAEPMALQVDFNASRLEGEVVGFYAPENLIGIISHPGEAFHYHWIDDKRTRTTHLDAFGVTQGTQLLLPKL